MTARTPPPARPVFLNPTQIRMPVGAWTSIGHRITGVLMAAAVPLAVYLLMLSLRDDAGFASARTLVGFWPVKLLAVLMVWAFAHHLMAGIRHLFMDFGMGSPLHAARRSAWAVNLAGVAVGLLAAWVMVAL